MCCCECVGFVITSWSGCYLCSACEDKDWKGELQIIRAAQPQPFCFTLPFNICLWVCVFCFRLKSAAENVCLRGVDWAVVSDASTEATEPQPETRGLSTVKVVVFITHELPSICGCYLFTTLHLQRPPFLASPPLCGTAVGTLWHFRGDEPLHEFQPCHIADHVMQSCAEGYHLENTVVLPIEIRANNSRRIWSQHLKIKLFIDSIFSCKCRIEIFTVK